MGKFTDFIKRNLPLITLILLAPIIGELVSGSSPPLEFFLNPLVPLILIMLYGGGALIIRELCIKWNKGWGSILILGIAYGIIEEGVGVKSFFDPTWMDLGHLGSFGRWLDVNWVWTIFLTIFHAVFSISIPIILTNFIYPEKERERYLTDERLKTTIIIFILYLVFISSILGYNYSEFFSLIKQPCPNLPIFYRVYFPNTFFSILFYLLSILIIFLLFFIAWKLKPDIIAPRNEEPAIRARWFGFAGFLFTFSLLFINYAGPFLIPIPIVIIILDILLPTFALLFIIRFAGSRNYSYHEFAFVSGLLSFLLFFDIILELSGIFGMSGVAAFFIIFLSILRKKVLARKRDDEFEDEKIKFCPLCGFSLKMHKFEKFCPSCGQKIENK